MCSTCKDAGWVRQERPLDDPMFGKTTPCPDCLVVPMAVGVPANLIGANFRDWHLKDNPKGWNHRLNPGMREAFIRCVAVSAGDAWCALLSGDIGTGKTHLAAAALYASVHPQPGHFWQIGDLLRWFRYLMFHDDPDVKRDEDTLVRQWGELPGLLVLDDLGAGSPDGNFTDRITYSVLNIRYTKRLPTILTTNDLKAVDPRVIDRFHEGAVVCSGQSARP